MPLETRKTWTKHPAPTKNIDVVRENQKDLVDILVELKPLDVIKG
jgi:hypothetical protein